MPSLSSKKAPGQDLAQKGRFGSIPEEKFNSRPGPSKMQNLSSKKAPGQDLAQKGRFGSVPEEKKVLKKQLPKQAVPP